MKTRYKYSYNKNNGLIYRFKGTTGTFMSTHFGTWGDDMSYPKDFLKHLVPISRNVVKFFEKEGGYSKINFVLTIKNK